MLIYAILTAAVPGYIFIFHALPDATIKINIVVGAGANMLTGIILAIGFCSACSPYIMDYNVLDTANLTVVIIVWGKQFPSCRMGRSQPLLL